MATALGGLLAEAGSASESASTACAADVVLESAWLPVVLLDTGRELWRPAQVEALLRHRLARVYDERGDAVAGWELSIDHRAGDAQGLGFGLSPLVKSAVVSAVAASGCTMTSIQPAVQWGRQRHRQRREGWWVWLEQDRAIVSHLEAGRMTAMNPAAALPSDHATCLAMLRIERLRLGIEKDDVGGVVAGWQQDFELTPQSGLAWSGLEAQAAAARGSVASAMPTRSAA
ncbi:hypothetical protein HZ992_12220 [Rhizobacter sp. AJA081-3]|uniref:hypothetical protein n=1 Tax=Rhizobacter sp. AJA081-3 TaxID=2753607 RepID=UPI001ADFBB34|nr:hypothetical protein [Rhizobacter sp. AJA081-3]QTN25664.1 hypothetical protein HZ992_12220 [Rhizobacter sp. AJA081-3]